MAQNTPGDSSTPQNNPRRRKRRRRASSHAQSPGGENRPNKQDGKPKEGGKQNEGAKGNKSSRNRRRKRRQGGNQRGSQRNNQRKRGGGGNRYRRGASNSAQHASANMETRDETSAGGLVVSGMAEAVGADGSVDLSHIYVALIGRLDRRGRLLWSMPKGHVEEGEHQWETARREVWEETGIDGEPFAELGIIDYWFVSDGVRIHKTVHHNLLRYVDGVLNDEDPEVTEVSWVPVSELIEHLAYADERKLARIAFDKMPDLARAEKEAGRTTPR